MTPLSAARGARRALLPIVLLAVAGACGDSTEPTPLSGLTATLVSPNGAEGAAVIELSGARIGAVTPMEGRVFSASGGGKTRVVVVRDAPGDVRFRVAVSDPNSPPAAAVVEVSDPDDQPRASLSGYRVEFTP